MSDAPTDRAPIPLRNWYALGVLTLIYTLSSLDRNVVSIVAEPLKLEYGLTDSQLGLLTGAAFAIAFSIAGLPLGMLVDRVNRKRLLAACLTVWSVLTVVSGAAHAFYVLLLARIGVASAESAASPASMSLISDLFPRSRRGTAVGLFFASSPIGLIIGFAVGGLVVAEWGWRAAFFLAGGPGLIAAAILLLTVREPRRGTFEPVAAIAVPRASLPQTLAVIWQRRTMLMLILGSVCMILGLAGIGAFISPFLIRVHDMPIQQVGLFAAIALGGGGLVGIPLGGVFSDRIGRDSAAKGQIFIAATAILSGLTAAAAFLVASPLVAMALLFVYAIATHLFYGASFATYLNIAPTSMRGTAVAVLMVSMNLGGYGLGPVLTGLASDFAGGLGVADPIRWSLVTLSGIYLLAAVLFVIASLTIRRDVILGEPDAG